MLPSIPSWLVGIIIITGLIAVALFREGRRARAIEDWCRAHEFVRHAEMPQELNLTIRGATDILRPGPARRYGMIIEGHIGGRRYVIADFEASSSAMKTGEWHILVMTPTGEGGGDSPIGEMALPEGLPGDARSIRYGGWNLIRWKGVASVAQVESFPSLLPRLFQR